MCILLINTKVMFIHVDVFVLINSIIVSSLASVNKRKES